MNAFNKSGVFNLSKNPLLTLLRQIFKHHQGFPKPSHRRAMLTFRRRPRQEIGGGAIEGRSEPLKAALRVGRHPGLELRDRPVREPDQLRKRFLRHAGRLPPLADIMAGELGFGFFSHSRNLPGSG